MFTNSSCGEKDNICKNGGHPLFNVINLSSKRINCATYWKYPDPTIGDFDKSNSKGYAYLESQPFTLSRGYCWEKHFEESQTNEFLHVFDQDTIEALDWDIVKSTGRGLIKIIEFNLDTLINNDFNFIITD